MCKQYSFSHAIIRDGIQYDSRDHPAGEATAVSGIAGAKSVETVG
jgi:hypothetical protein